MSGTIVSSGQVVVVSAGQSASGYTVLSGGELLVEGTVASTIIDAGGYVEVESGGVASSTSDFGDQVVDSGGSGWATTIASGGLEDVSGVASAALVETGGLQDIEYDGTASATTIASRGLQAVYGSASGTTVQSGGFALAAQSEQLVFGSNGPELVEVGGVVSAATVDAGGFLISLPAGVISNATGAGTTASTGVVDVDLSAHSAVYFGETAAGDTVTSGFVQYVLTSGTATDTSVSSGAEQDVYGSAVGTIVSGNPFALHNGSQVVESGGVASGALIVGGEEDVGSGGLAAGTTVDEGLQSIQGGAASGAVLSGSGKQEIQAGSAVSTTVDPGGSQTIDAGAMATATQVDGGRQLDLGLAVGTTVLAGTELVGEFAVASATTVSGSGAQYVSAYGIASGAVLEGGGYQELASGGEDLGGAVQSGGFQLVDPGGVASSTVVSSGGVEDLAGSAVSTTIESGGLLIVSSGASLSGVTVEAGGVAVVLPGASASGASGAGEIVSTGVLDVSLDSRTAAYLGSTVTGHVLGPDVTEYVLPGGTAVFTTISAGSASDTDQIVYGSALHTVIDGGEQDVQSGGVARDTTLSGAAVSAVQVVSSGGLASGTTIDSAAVQYDNGSAAATVVGSGGVQDVAGTASGATIDFGGAQLVFGRASGTTVSSGGFEHIESGGQATSTTVEGGGLVQIPITQALSGPVAGEVTAEEAISGVTIESGGIVAELDIQSGVVVTGTTVNSGGEQAVYGAASATVVHSGGLETVWGSASGTVVDSGGSQFVSGGGSAADTTVNSGGVMDVDGTISGAAIDGGLVVLENFAKAGGSLDFGPSGGVLELGATVSFTLSAATVSGFTHGAIDFAALPFVSGFTSATLSGSTLTVGDGHTSYSLTLGSEPPGEQFTTQNDGFGGVEVKPQTVCYTAGVRILTERGEVRVADLRVGDRVMTLAGELQPIVWIGRQRIPALNRRSSEDVLPVRIRPGALAEGVPSRDLVVSPAHGLYLDGFLVPARRIVNGATILREADAGAVEYWHFELPEHAVVFADGAPAETYLDVGNRNALRTLDHAAVRLRDAACTTRPCFPVLEEGEALVAIRARLLDRVESLGVERTADPDLHLLADGALIRPSEVQPSVFRFELGRRPTDARLRSRATAPADVLAAATDTRRLGVSLSRIELRGMDATLVLGTANGALIEGFHEPESGHRWTDGDARLPADLFQVMGEGPFTLDVHVVGRTVYWLKTTETSGRSRAIAAA